MEITPHLSDNQMAEFLTTVASGVDTHLELCDACLDETSNLREAVRVLRADEPQDESFWLRQEEAIDARILRWKTAKATPLRRSIWVAATVAVATLIVAGVLSWHRPATPFPVQQAQTVQDHDLLLRVEQSLSENGPEALAPAAMLAQEISPQDFSASTDSNSTHKGEQQP